MKKLLESGSRLMRRIFLGKREKSRYRSFDTQFRTAYGKTEVAKKKKRLAIPLLTSVFRKKTKTVKEDGYRRREPKKFPVLQIALGLFLVVAVVFAFGMKEGLKGWRKMIPGIAFFQLHEVVFTGCRVTTGEALRNRAGLVLYQTNLLRLDTGEVEKGIAGDPWVNAVKVERDWPSRLIVTITEHVPLALVGDQGDKKSGLSYIDRSGAVFMAVEAGHDVDFPVITGLSRISSEKQRQEVLADIFGFLRQTEKNNPNLPTQAVSEVHVNDDGELVIFLVEYPFPIFFGRGRVETKYNRLVKVLEVLYKKHENKMQISQVEYIRMDYLNDKVLVAQRGSG
jgi:cell division protein FtsQ